MGRLGPGLGVEWIKLRSGVGWAWWVRART